MLFVATSRGSILPFTIIREALWYDCHQKNEKKKNCSRMSFDASWSGNGKNATFLILMPFQIKLMSLCRSQTVISFWRIWSFICYHNAKINFHHFHSWHFSLTWRRRIQEWYQRGLATCAVFDLIKSSLLFIFLLSHFEGLWGFQVARQGLGV